MRMQGGETRPDEAMLLRTPKRRKLFPRRRSSEEDVVRGSAVGDDGYGEQGAQQEQQQQDEEEEEGLLSQSGSSRVSSAAQLAQMASARKTRSALSKQSNKLLFEEMLRRAELQDELDGEEDAGQVDPDDELVLDSCLRRVSAFSVEKLKQRSEASLLESERSSGGLTPFHDRPSGSTGAIGILGTDGIKLVNSSSGSIGLPASAPPLVSASASSPPCFKPLIPAAMARDEDLQLQDSFYLARKREEASPTPVDRRKR